ncbi:Transcription factor iws1, partial [Rhizoclosmatium hyalinum]
MDSDEEDQPAPFVVEDSQEMIPEDVADPAPADDPAPPLAPTPAAPVAANPYTLDDIFGGGDSDLDDDIDADKGLDFSSDDEKDAKLKQVANDFDEALNRIKHKRAKKLDGDDPEIDEMIVNLVEKMKEAAHADQEFNRLQQPAIAKIKLLNIVTNHLAKTHLYEQFLDNNLLEGMKLWLEPLRGDGSLPNLEIQMAMMNALAKLPIRSEQLRYLQ